MKTRELFHDGWLDSGDRAYMASGDVYITGRIKDIIIRAGQHIYPQEIEAAVGEIPGICRGGVAVFGVPDRAAGTERVVALAETRETEASARAALQARANEVASEIAGAPLDEIVFAPPGTTPKTASGKIRRGAAKELYARGELGAPLRALRWQLLRLSLLAFAAQFRRLNHLIMELLYAAWWWSVMGLGIGIGWLAVMSLPRLAWRWAALRWIARRALAAAGSLPTLQGGDRIPRGNAILLFNHASYVDAFVIAAVAPGEPAFVAKSELGRQFFAGPFLRKLGVLFVERYDMAASLADAEAALAAARQGRLLVFFPEGAFTRRAGLSDFYLGAFKAAAEANLPVYPGVLRGTRSMLRADQWFPRRAPISIEIAAPLVASGADFQSVLKLRDDARKAMLARCGEPDLGELVKPAAPQSGAKITE